MLQMVYDGVETREMLRLMPEPPLSDEEYYNSCAANPDLRIERTSEGEIEIMPPTGLESSYRNSELTVLLRDWAIRDGRASRSIPTRSFSSKTVQLAVRMLRGSIGPNWPPKKESTFPHLCPDFVIE